MFVVAAVVLVVVVGGGGFVFLFCFCLFVCFREGGCCLLFSVFFLGNVSEVYYVSILQGPKDREKMVRDKNPNRWRYKYIY